MKGHYLVIIVFLWTIILKYYLKLVIIKLCMTRNLFQDRNDIPPVFTIVPHPITLDDDVSIGTSVTNLIATDADGTAPGNKVSCLYS